MKIYCLGLNKRLMAADDVLEKDICFAFFAVVGTWVAQRQPCKTCDWHWQTIAAPLLVQWEPSADVIGDFSWDGPYGYTFVVKEQVAQSLQSMGFECRFLPVDYVKPKRRKRLKSVAYPYAGPALKWGVCESVVELDEEASEVVITNSCPTCGDIRHTFRNDGIVIRRKAWHGEKLFRIASNGHSEATFITEEGRRSIERMGWSNFVYADAGEIVS